MRIKGDGNVGIGTASPNIGGQGGSGTLTVKNTATYGILEVAGAGSTQGGEIQFYGDTTKFGSITGEYSSSGNGMMIFRTLAGSTFLENLRIVNDRVGIGTASPASGSKLTIRDASIANARFENTVGGFLEVGITANATSEGFIKYTNNLRFFEDSTERFRIIGSEVIIGGIVDQGAYNLQVGGTGVWGGGAYVNGSDRRLKTNIKAIETGLDVIEKLNPVTFNYIEEYSKDTNLQTGFIAQEMLEAMSEKDYVDSIVQKGKEFYGVAYQSLIPILVKAVQELTKRIEELESK
jgi:hypothetical protein